jgi:hypothetical protein
MIGLAFGDAVRIEDRDNSGFPSLIPRQLPASPMLVLPRRVEHPFDVTVERSHHANSREHRWPVMFQDQQYPRNLYPE